jgi:polyphosphate glucokinase
MAADNATPAHDDRLILTFDIGGSHLKAAVYDASGALSSGPARVPTPQPAKPEAILTALIGLTEGLGTFDCISIGFPGVVRGGFVFSAPNLGGGDWHGFPLGAAVAEKLGKPVRMLNDASVQGLGVIAGRGLECVLTLGTGMGFALFQDGRIAPHLELSQHPVKTKTTYDEYVGEAAYEACGQKHWNRRIGRIIKILDTVVGYDKLYIGGGNARRIKQDLPANVELVSNQSGLSGGVRLWDDRMDHAFAPAPGAFARQSTASAETPH